MSERGEASRLYLAIGAVLVFTRQRAPGALPSGARIRKRASQPGDTNPDGAPGSVLGSVLTPLGLGYFVLWDAAPRAVFVAAAKIEAMPL